MGLREIALVAFAAPTLAFAVPSISVVDNGNGSATVQVVTDAPGSLAVELAIELTDQRCLPGESGLGETVTVNSALFNDPNPGDNPFLPGSPRGGDTTGLWVDRENSRLFAAFGAGDHGIGSFDLLSFDYFNDPEYYASGIVAQAGQNHAVADWSPSVTGVFYECFGDIDGDGDIDPADFAILAGNWLANPAPPPGGARVGDLDNSGDVGPADFAILASNWLVGTGLSTAVPEPSAAALAWLGLVGIVAPRIRSRLRSVRY